MSVIIDDGNVDVEYTSNEDVYKKIYDEYYNIINTHLPIEKMSGYSGFQIMSHNGKDVIHLYYLITGCRWAECDRLITIGGRGISLDPRIDIYLPLTDDKIELTLINKLKFVNKEEFKKFVENGKLNELLNISMEFSHKLEILYKNLETDAALTQL